MGNHEAGLVLTHVTHDGRSAHVAFCSDALVTLIERNPHVLDGLHILGTVAVSPYLINVDLNE